MRCSKALLFILVAALLAGGHLAAQSFDTEPQAADLGLRRDLPSPAGSPRSGAELESLTQEVSEQLRCPMCQGMSVADSPSASAQAIKDEVRTLLSDGFSEEQIKEYFEGTYGEFVLLSPKREGLNWLLWLAPVALFLGGLSWILIVRGGSERPAVDVDDDLDPYLERVRQLADPDRSSGTSAS